MPMTKTRHAEIFCKDIQYVTCYEFKFENSIIINYVFWSYASFSVLRLQEMHESHETQAQWRFSWKRQIIKTDTIFCIV